MRDAVIVGGGIVGILAAIQLRLKGVKVTLIEKDSECGGLLKSVQNNSGIYFDYGTHIPSETSNDELDSILFSEMNNDKWNSFSTIKAGNYFNKNLYDKSQFIYLPSLKSSSYENGLFQLLNSKFSRRDLVESDNLLEYYNKLYGSIFTEDIFRPILKKFLGTDMEYLHSSAASVFSLTRLIPGNEFLTNNLKKIPLYDEKLAFVNYHEGVSNQKKFYPINGYGVQQWVMDILLKAETLGVKILTETFITSIDIKDKRIESLKLNTGEIIKTNILVWTANTYLLSNLIGLTNNMQKPKMRTMVLFNFVFDKHFLVENHYINCYDSDFKTFRVTLYPNLKSGHSENTPINCTVEVLMNKGDYSDIENEIFNELVIMGIISDDTEVIDVDKIEINDAFPIITPEYHYGIKLNNENIRDSVRNLVMAGKATGESFFLSDSLIDVFNKIRKLNF
ncbi:FAD-dependent oxidoreductase [Solibacillus sp. FSL H8-0523]|uniref:FAD-dependent oxidoreductase n=1 Tax=Solibacillus sp. FSL H8-0523 TaxID=2954511 RepID=UPI0031017253